MSKKEKEKKLGWGEFQQQFGKTKSLTDELPTAPRDYSGGFSGRGGRRQAPDRYAQREPRSTGFNESSDWRNAGSSRFGSRGGFNSSSSSRNFEERDWRVGSNNAANATEATSGSGKYAGSRLFKNRGTSLKEMASDPNKARAAPAVEESKPAKVSQQQPSKVTNSFAELQDNDGRENVSVEKEITNPKFARIMEGKAIELEELEDLVISKDFNLKARNLLESLVKCLIESIKSKTLSLRIIIIIFKSSEFKSSIFQLLLPQIINQAVVSKDDFVEFLKKEKFDIFDLLKLQDLSESEKSSRLSKLGLGFLAPVPSEKASVKISDIFSDSESSQEILAKLKDLNIQDNLSDFFLNVFNVVLDKKSSLKDFSSAFQQVDSPDDQLVILNSAQLSWFEHDQPKKVGLELFRSLYDGGFINGNVFVSWRDSVENKSNGKGKLLIQVNSFVSEIETFLEKESRRKYPQAYEEEEEDDEEEEEEFEVDY